MGLFLVSDSVFNLVQRCHSIPALSSVPTKYCPLSTPGGMSEVYRARDTCLERSVAIKILPAHLFNDPAQSGYRQILKCKAQMVSVLAKTWQR